jgi:hypothetical protein
VDRLDRERALQQAAERLGQWLERAGDQVGPIPPAVWRRISELAARGRRARRLARGRGGAV